MHTTSLAHPARTVPGLHHRSPRCLLGFFDRGLRKAASTPRAFRLGSSGRKRPSATMWTPTSPATIW